MHSTHKLLNLTHPATRHRPRVARAAVPEPPRPALHVARGEAWSLGLLEQRNYESLAPEGMVKEPPYWRRPLSSPQVASTGQLPKETARRRRMRAARLPLPAQENTCLFRFARQFYVVQVQ